MSKNQRPDNSEQIKAEFLKVDRAILEKRLNTTKSTMSQIVNGIIRVSPKRAREIEEITCGVVSAKVLRPDIFS